jgi:hypothetical protein
MPARTKAQIENAAEEIFQKRLETLHNERKQPLLFLTADKAENKIVGSDFMKRKYKAVIECEENCNTEANITTHLDDCLIC